jgi:hypothetical protein
MHAHTHSNTHHPHIANIFNIDTDIHTTPGNINDNTQSRWIQTRKISIL